MASSPTFTNGILVCPTSHIDWDWNFTFDQYYASNSDADPQFTGRDTVQNIFKTALNLFSQKIGFMFSIAEVGYIQRFAQDNPGDIAGFVAAGDAFCLMGGGITSPDNLVCNGELFIRNYLVGRTWANSVGLGVNMYDTAWLPDDFGHDPQLPIVLNAMGLSTVGLSRVPGSPQGSPCAAPINPPGPSIAAQLNTNGLVFTWKAGDGSAVTTLFMPNTYGTVGYLSMNSLDSNVATLDNFVKQYDTGWPNGLRFVPVGIDFATPEVTWQGGSVNWVDVTNSYNSNYGNSNGVPGTTGTWKMYMDAVLQRGGTLPVNDPLYAQNYWTGHFASRPQLKINQNAAARGLMAAETISALLRVYSSYASSGLDYLDSTIWNGWQALAPSSHHDFVTGTSPDNTYYNEQLPLSKQAVSIAEDVVAQGMNKLAQGVKASPQPGETPVVICNTLGFARSNAGLVELADSSAISTVQTTILPDGCTELAATGNSCIQSVRVGNTYQQIQRGANGNILFMANPPSMGYETVYLSEQPPVTPLLPGNNQIGDTAVMANSLMSVTISKDDGWGISVLAYNADGQTLQLFPDSAVGNQLRLYNDNGNIYQFGNEPLSCSGTQPNYGTFSQDTNAQFVGGDAQWLEQGPLRWRLQAQVTETTHNQTYALEYTLVEGEQLLRIKVTGAAPSGTSVAVAFPMVNQNGVAPTTLSYGTPHYQQDVLPVPNWPGPTFVATHNYVIPCIQQAQYPVGSIYHGGIPAWTLDSDSTLLGVLFRNTPAGGRGACGSDNDTHTQEFVLAPPVYFDSNTHIVTPLKNALSAITPLQARIVTGLESRYAALGETASLGSVTGMNGGLTVDNEDVMIRVARVQAPDGNYPTNFSTTNGNVPTSMALRTYNQNNTATQLTLGLPFLSDVQSPQTQMVTALEAPLTPLTPVPNNAQTLTINSPNALATLRIAWSRSIASQAPPPCT